ncbi:MAG: DUF364 domain-containing protein [Thermodesulfobacteriota bacterium]
MSTVEHIRNIASAAAAALAAKDVRLGLGYTAVRTEDDNIGLAFTFRNVWDGGCRVLQRLRPLAGRPVKDLIALSGAANTQESALGLAAANAVLNRSRPELLSGDLLDHLRLQPSDRVGMVGYFAPLLPKLRTLVAQVAIFELADREPPPEGLRPAGEALQELPRCQAALLTATALVNGTLDELLVACQGLREVAILGASTPLCPEAFAGTPVTLLSGVIVTEPEKLLGVVSEGGGTRAFKGLVRKVNRRV